MNPKLGILPEPLHFCCCRHSTAWGEGALGEQHPPPAPPVPGEPWEQHVRRDAEQITPGEPKTGDFIRAPSPLLQQTPPQRGAKWPPGSSIPLLHPIPGGPWEQHVPLLPHVQSKGAGRGERETLPSLFFWGGIFPNAWLPLAQEAGNPWAAEGEAVSAQPPPLTHLAAKLIFYCGNCQRFHHRENQISLCRDKAKAQPHNKGGGSFLSPGCRRERDVKYKEISWGFR